VRRAHVDGHLVCLNLRNHLVRGHRRARRNQQRSHRALADRVACTASKRVSNCARHCAHALEHAPMDGTSTRVGAPPAAAAGAAALAAAFLGAAAPAAPSVNVATSCPTLTLSPFATCSRAGRRRRQRRVAARGASERLAKGQRNAPGWSR
jgi:hypothetical protein